MRIGISIFLTDLTLPPGELAREAEARGFSSLWLPEHTHIPVSRQSPPPGGEAELPEPYRRTLDPFVALAYAAAATRSLRVGTGICLVAQRDPLVTAKAVATLDHLSGGRFRFGVGFGWNVEEMAHHGVAFRERRALVREKVALMRALWTEEEAAHEGERLRLAPSWAWPKPRRPPPVLLGGRPGPRLFADIAAWGDGWLPLPGSRLRESLPALRRATEAAGRDPAALRIIPYALTLDHAKLDHLAALGIDEVVTRLPHGGREAVLPAIDAAARFVTPAP